MADKAVLRDHLASEHTKYSFVVARLSNNSRRTFPRERPAVDNLKKMKNKLSSTAVTFVAAAAFTVIAFNYHFRAEAEKRGCRSFPDRASAQLAFDRDPVSNARLDGRDHDGRVCESFDYNKRK